MDYTSTALLASIRRRAMLPSSTVDGTTDADLLALANEELQSRLIADIMSIREEYFVRYVDITRVSGQSEYRIPKRAIGGVLRDVVLMNSAQSTRRLPRISPEMLDRIDTASSAMDTYGYVVRGNSIVLLFTSNDWSTLRLYYFVRPNEIQLASYSAKEDITEVSANASQITITGPSSLGGGPFDIVATTPSFEILAVDVQPISSDSISSPPDIFLTFAAGVIPPTVSVGDHLIQAGNTIYPNIPAEWHPVLAQRVAVKALEALGDTEGMTNAQHALLEIEEKVRVLATPRVQGSLEKIINRNAGIRMGPFRRWMRNA